MFVKLIDIFFKNRGLSGFMTHHTLTSQNIHQQMLLKITLVI